MLADFSRWLDGSIGKAAHELDAAARTLGLVAGLQIGWTGGETEPAVDAGERAVVGSRVQLQRGLAGGLGRIGNQWRRHLQQGQ